MNNHPRLRYRTAVLAVAVSALAPATAVAQTSQAAPEPGSWRYAASLYVYLPSIRGSTVFPADSGGTPIEINVDELKGMFMGAFDVHNGRWGVFTDLIYLNLGGGKAQSRDFTIGDIGLPADTSANFDWDLKGWVWTVAGQYRVASDPQLTMDALAGARLFDLKQRLNWSISGSLGPIAPSGRTGSAEVGDTVWDGIVGVKGRYAFGANREWSVPFYLDVGTGESDLTWQAAAGISYAFQWGELSALWRYLGYDMKSGKKIKDINFNGPMIGATFRW